MKENTFLIIKLISCFLLISLIVVVVTFVTFGSHSGSESVNYRVKEFSVVKKVTNRTTTRFVRLEEESSQEKFNKYKNNEIQPVEFIVPYKLPPEWEPYEDLIKQTKHRFYSSNYNSSSQSHPFSNNYDSGHFRIRINNTPWDPHPQYKFHAFGKLFHLVLSINLNGKSNGQGQDQGLRLGTNYNKNNILLTIHEGNMTWRQSNVNEYKCLYSGYIKNDNGSDVAVSLCHGMTGHIRTSNGSYFIQPAEEWKGPLIPILHSITSISPAAFSNTTTTLINNDDFSHSHDHHDPVLSLSSSRPRSNSSTSLPKPHPDVASQSPIDASAGAGPELPRPRPHSRKKRSMSTEHYVELMIVTDSTMSAYHGENLKHYVLTLISIVSLVYKDASIGNPINIELVKFHILKDTDFTSNWNRHASNSSNHSGGGGVGSSASEMLRNFCKWQKEYNDPDENSLLHHDTALLLTRETICRNPWLHKCDTLGLAELGTMCDHYASCAIVQDNGLSAAFTIAHELGHVMNMPHEDDKKCIPLKTGLNAHTHYVMSRMLDHNTYPWAWSKCSRHFLTEFLDAGHGYCLEDTPITTNLLDGDHYNEAVGRTGNNNRMLQPGEIFSQNKQCQLVFGETSKLCSYMPVCRRLWCTTGDGGGEEEGCRTQHMPWADGTPCAKNKWCQRGSCVLRDLNKLRVIDGGWGQWGVYGHCSRTCGGGIRRSMRECDNPLPSNGGKYCIGPRVRYESCNTQDCSKQIVDFRTEQCKKFNQDNFNIQGLPKDVQWVAKYSGILGKDRCRLYCRVIGSSAYYLLNEKVIDGTPCGLDSFDLCVNGACLPAGCDKILYSNKGLDMCGVCGGNGSTCKTEGGSYNETKYGYNTVVRIPAGASSLDVRQRGLNDSARDDNYLALLDPVKHEYILNGNFIVSMFKRTIDSNGIILEYSGSDSTVERINCSRPLKHDLIVQVLSVGKLYQPDIRFQYVINSLNESVGNNDGVNGVNGGYNNVGSSESASDQLLVINSDYRWRCNIDCTYICVNSLDEHVDEVYCSELSKFNVCHCPYEWRCRSCNNVCYNATIQVHDYYCRHKSQVRCEECSYDWKYTDWGQCSALCGKGVKTRGIQCIHKNVIVSPTYCEREAGIEKEELEQECSHGPCGKWIIHDWTPCSRTCGSGVSRGLYACHQQNLGGSLLPSHYCSTEEKPLVERECQGPPCYTWKVTPWSKCICRNGDEHHQEYQKRRIYCSNYHNNEEIDEAYCNGIPHTFKNTQNCTECIQLQPISRRRKHNRNGSSMENFVLNLSNDPTKNYRWVSVKQCNSNEIDSNIDALCMNQDGITVDAYYCQHLTKPLMDKNCTDFAYNTTTSADVTRKWIWVIESGWSECSANCNGGTRSRNVVCKLEINAVVKPDFQVEALCDARLKPESRQECNPQPCSNHINQNPGVPTRAQANANAHAKRKYKWVYGVWTKQCRGECGKGKRYRPVQCVLNKPTNEQIPLDESFCKGMKKPRNEKPCFKTKSTCQYNWIPSQWSECSKSCGYGLEERTVNCHHVNSNGWIDPDPLQNIAFCEQMQKPKDYRYCMRSDCNSIYEWKVEAWSQCHQRCLKSPTAPRRPEKQKRKVYCARKSDGLKVRNVFCTPLKPERRRNCANSQQPKYCDEAHPSTCLQILRNSNGNNRRVDGEYSLQIGGSRIEIYCHGMNTSEPKEYLTLREDDNYSEIYGKRLIRPETCPRHGARLESCECVQDEGRKVGYTKFMKISLNVTNLSINTEDFTFTRQVSGQPIGFGQSGDCYSSINCPQGRFSINLNGTGFILSSGSTWTSQGHKAAMWINKSEDGLRVFGKCGGYCGSCFPHRLTGLKLQVP